MSCIGSMDISIVREIPELIVAIKGNCLSVCIYDESLAE